MVDYFFARSVARRGQKRKSMVVGPCRNSLFHASARYGRWATAHVSLERNSPVAARDLFHLPGKALSNHSGRIPIRFTPSMVSGRICILIDRQRIGLGHQTNSSRVYTRVKRFGFA